MTNMRAQHNYFGGKYKPVAQPTAMPWALGWTHWGVYSSTKELRSKTKQNI